MGKSSRHRAKFLTEHPICCFCGGGIPAAGTDHVPSRACFDNRVWPEGFEFPACEKCNGDTANAEQVVAFFSRSLANPNAPIIDEEVVRLGVGSRNNSPGPMNEFEHSYRPISKELGVFETGPEIAAAFEIVFQKWGRAFYYLETGAILPTGGKVIGLLLTLERIQRGGISPGLFEGIDRPIRRNGVNLSGQFGYLHQAQSNDGLYMFTVMFRRAFAAVLFVDVTGEHVARMLAKDELGGTHE